MCGKHPKETAKNPKEAEGLGKEVPVSQVFGTAAKLPTDPGSKTDFETKKFFLNPKTYGISCVKVTGVDGKKYHVCREWDFLFEGGNDRLAPHQLPGPGEMRPTGDILFQPISLDSALIQHTNAVYEAKEPK